MSYVVGLDLGQVTDSSGIVVVETNILPTVGTELVRHGYVPIGPPVFRLPDGTNHNQAPSPDHRRAAHRAPSRGDVLPAIVDRVKELFGKLHEAGAAIDATGVGRSTVGSSGRRSSSPRSY